VRDIVLVLDNCEHVFESSAALVGELLRRGQRVRVIVTSRRALGVPGEHVFALAGLGEAVVLFRERARLVDPALEVDEETVELCERLDNLPLAIELAAARVQTMRPADIIERIDQRFRMLRSTAVGTKPASRDS
jgi:predicted ATPase